MLKKFLKYWSEDRGLTWLLIITILNIFILYPLYSIGSIPKFVVSVATTLQIISGVLAVAHNRRRLVLTVIGFAILYGIINWIDYSFDFISTAVLHHIFALIFFAFLIILLLRKVFRDGEVNIHRIVGAVVVYMLIGLAWSEAYQIIYLSTSTKAFNIDTALPYTQDTTVAARFVYFSFVTLCTVGYGDMTPIHPLARSMAMLEALTGILFPAILIARLVAMELDGRRHRHKNEE